MTKALIFAVLCSASLSTPAASTTQVQGGTAESKAPPPAPPPVAPTGTIKGKPIYVYSFLDFLEAEFTRKVLDEVNAGLSSRLNALGSNGPILEYRKTTQGEFLSDSSGYGSSSTAVPVRQVIEHNASVEAGSGTKLRLVIFPARFDTSGSWRFYDIKWALFDGSSQRLLWSFSYSGKHLVIFSNKENADSRAKKILDAAFQDMKVKGLI